jgi:hypothetical protein
MAAAVSSAAGQAAGSDDQAGEVSGLLQRIRAMQQLQQLHLSLELELHHDALSGLKQLTMLSVSSELPS